MGKCGASVDYSGSGREQTAALQAEEALSQIAADKTVAASSTKNSAPDDSSRAFGPIHRAPPLGAAIGTGSTELYWYERQ
jgi:hypothetical protein